MANTGDFQYVLNMDEEQIVDLGNGLYASLNHNGDYETRFVFGKLSVAQQFAEYVRHFLEAVEDDKVDMMLEYMKFFKCHKYDFGEIQEGDCNDRK